MVIKNLAVVGLLLTIVILFAAKRVRSASVSKVDPAFHGKDGLTLLDRKAKAANDASDETEIKQYTDSVVNTFGPFGMAADVLKEKLFALEKQERSVNAVGITEGSLAKAINKFATKIGAPDFAQTSALQVRSIRAALHFRLPNGVAPSLADKPVTWKSSMAAIREEMSPSEASIVVSTLLRQKLTDESYQVTPGEWDEAFRAWQKTADDVSSTVSEKTASRYTLVAGVRPIRAEELEKSLGQYKSTIANLAQVETELNDFVEDATRRD